MIDFECWKKNIYKGLNYIADKNFQELAWFGAEDPISSPEEVYCYLISDNIFEEFLEYPELNYSEYQKQHAHQFIKDFDGYYDSQPGEYLDPSKIIHDLNWDTIRLEAQQLIVTLDLSKYNSINKRY